VRGAILTIFDVDFKDPIIVSCYGHKTLGFVETGDDTTHPITKIDKVPLSMQDG
jgi:hypothetical protein